MTIKFLLVLLYPLLIFARIVNALLGRDPLKLRQTKTASYWIAREFEPDRASFFSETSAIEGAKIISTGRIITAILRKLTSNKKTHRIKPGETYTPQANREQGIPDEVYTLW